MGNVILNLQFETLTKATGELNIMNPTATVQMVFPHGGDTTYPEAIRAFRKLGEVTKQEQTFPEGSVFAGCEGAEYRLQVSRSQTLVLDTQMHGISYRAFDLYLEDASLPSNDLCDPPRWRGNRTCLVRYGYHF